MMSAARLLYRTACDPSSPALYRPGGGVPVSPVCHPADNRPGYLLRLPCVRTVFADGTGATRSIDLDAVAI